MGQAAERKLLQLLKSQPAVGSSAPPDPAMRVLDLLRAAAPSQPPFPDEAPQGALPEEPAQRPALEGGGEAEMELTLLLDRGGLSRLLALVENHHEGGVYRFLAVAAGLLLADQPGPRGLLVRMYAQSVLETALDLEAQAEQGLPLYQVASPRPDERKEMLRGLFSRRPRHLHCGPHDQPSTGLLLTAKLSERQLGRLYRRLFGQHQGLLHHLRIVELLGPTAVLDLSPWPQGAARTALKDQVCEALAMLHCSLDALLGALERPEKPLPEAEPHRLAQAMDDTLIALERALKNVLASS
jgi:hypothetical protein